MRIKQYKLLLVFLMMRLFVVGQTTGYHYQANINSVDSSGFYNIVLTPEINAHVKIDYSDLRIVNDSGKWVPHVLWFPYEQSSHDLGLVESRIIKKQNSNLFTDLILESVSRNTSKLLLEIKNTQAERYCTLTGSDDLLSWFIINDSISIKPLNDPFKENSNFTIAFPPVNYKYLRIYINNRGKESFNIVNIKETIVFPAKDSIRDIDFIENPACVISQIDSFNHSYIKIIQQAAYHFSKISLKLSGAKFYNRNAGIYFPSTSANSFSNPGELKKTVVLSNNSTLEFYLFGAPKVFYLIIENEDNPPLKIESIKTYNGYAVATAWLEKANHYKLIMDNTNAIKPNYDLTMNNISSKVYPIATVNTITPIPQIAVTVTPVNKNKTMMWLIIAAAVLVLGFFTYKLITDMKKSKS